MWRTLHVTRARIGRSNERTNERMATTTMDAIMRVRVRLDDATRRCPRFPPVKRRLSRAQSFTPQVENPPEARPAAPSLSLSLSLSPSFFLSIGGQWESSSNYTVRLMVIGLTSLDCACSLRSLPLSASRFRPLSSDRLTIPIHYETCMAGGRGSIQPADIGWPTGNGKKLSSTQAQLGQATCLAVA